MNLFTTSGQQMVYMPVATYEGSSTTVVDEATDYVVGSEKTVISDEYSCVPTLPTESPTAAPTPIPTPIPTAEPTVDPTPVPTVDPTAAPTSAVTGTCIAVTQNYATGEISTTCANRNRIG